MASTKRGMNDMQRAAGLQKAASRRTDQKNKGLKYKGKYAGPDQYKGVIPEGYTGKAKGKYFGKEANLGQNVRTKPAPRKPLPVDDVLRTAPWRRRDPIYFPSIPTNNGTLNNDMSKIPRNGSPTTSENESSDAYKYLMDRKNDDMLKKAYFNWNKMNKKKKKKPLPHPGNPAWYQGPRLPGRKYAE